MYLFREWNRHVPVNVLINQEGTTLFPSNSFIIQQRTAVLKAGMLQKINFYKDLR